MKWAMSRISLLLFSFGLVFCLSIIIMAVDVEMRRRGEPAESSIPAWESDDWLFSLLFSTGVATLFTLGFVTVLGLLHLGWSEFNRRGT